MELVAASFLTKLPNQKESKCNVYVPPTVSTTANLLLPKYRIREIAGNGVVAAPLKLLIILLKHKQKIN